MKLMKLPHSILPIFASLAFAGCAQYATVKETKPRRTGFVTDEKQPLPALGSYVDAAEAAWRKLEQNPRNIEARSDYNFAVSRIFGTLRTAKLAPWTQPLRVGAKGERTLAYKSDPRLEWNPGLYELIPADQLRIRGTYVTEREIKDGIGAPLVANRISPQPVDYAPTPHAYYGLTGLARFEGKRCVLSVEDPLASETTRVAGRTYPLAADFTAPLAMMLVAMHPQQLETPRLLHPDKFAETTKIARLEPFNPKKTVVLVVHGLKDSPATWAPMINHLRADEDVRERYQFWFFSYPSGYPYSYSAAILRRELDHAEKRYPSNKKIIVIGHSMGGCVTRTLVTDSGNRIWDHMFTVPPEKIEATPEHRHILTESAIFRNRREIGRVIFISSPHRGSDLATNWIGRISSSLVKAPAALLATGQETMRFRKVTPGEMHLKRFPDSVDTLAPNNAFVVAINQIPIAPGVPYHSIVGDRGRGDTPKSSDGVVP